MVVFVVVVVAGGAEAGEQSIGAEIMPFSVAVMISSGMKGGGDVVLLDVLDVHGDVDG